MTHMGWAAVLKLTAADISLANDCAETMIRNALKTGASTRFGSNSDTKPHFEGALGEIAFARFRGVEWICHPADFAQPDVDGYEVRTIGPTAKYADVKAKANDPAGRRIASVMLLGPHYAGAIIVGWTTAGDVKRLGTKRDPGRRGAPAYFAGLEILDRSFP